jgi:transmembrane sensor
MNGHRSDSPGSRDEAVEAAAAEWLVRGDRGLTPAQQDAFLQWLAASPAHRESFERHRRMWAECDALAQWRPEHSAEPNPDLLARRRPTVRHWWAPLALVAAAAVAVLLWRTDAPPRERPLAFEAASYRQETLADGSVIDLKGGAHVVVQFTAAERRVLLVQGEAQFTVAKNPARPFVVRAGGVDVRAVGTAFNVRIAGPRIDVLVTEGTVQVARPPAAPAGSGVPAPQVLASLSAGHRTSIAVEPAAPPPVVQPASSQEMAQWLEWKPHMLDFESAPLAEVVAIFNRHNRAQLVIGDEVLRTLPIVASIRSDNVDGFVRLLEATSGVRAEPRGDEIVLRQAR